VDSGWIKALELPAKITGGLFIACAVIWYLDGNDTLKLDDIGSWLRPVILIIWVGSGALFGASIVGDVWAVGAAYLKKRAEKKDDAAKEAAEIKAIEEFRKATIAHLDRLSEKENSEAAKALKGASPSFESWAHSTGAGQLIAKGLIYSPQGTYNQDYFPFTFYDFVWDALQERREAILEKEAVYELERRKRR
jgi:hypothetical protein